MLIHILCSIQSEKKFYGEPFVIIIIYSKLLAVTKEITYTLQYSIKNITNLTQKLNKYEVVGPQHRFQILRTSV